MVAAVTDFSGSSRAADLLVLEGAKSKKLWHA
jgi:hypothetical protein